MKQRKREGCSAIKQEACKKGSNIGSKVGVAQVVNCLGSRLDSRNACWWQTKQGKQRNALSNKEAPACRATTTAKTHSKRSKTPRMEAL